MKSIDATRPHGSLARDVAHLASHRVGETLAPMAGTTRGLEVTGSRATPPVPALGSASGFPPFPTAQVAEQIHRERASRQAARRVR